MNPRRQEMEQELRRLIDNSCRQGRGNIRRRFANQDEIFRLKRRIADEFRDEILEGEG